MELRETILEETIQAFNKKGLKFTMDDIAALLGISKKTIYTVFQDKNTLVSEMVVLIPSKRASRKYSRILRLIRLGRFGQF